MIRNDSKKGVCVVAFRKQQKRDQTSLSAWIGAIEMIFFGDRKTCICLTWRNQFRQNKINSLEITEFHFFTLYRVLLEI